MIEKTAYEHRYDNLQVEFKKFVRETGIPKYGSVKAFAKQIDTPERYLGHLLAGRKIIGETTARKIEKALGLIKGRFDRGNNIEDILKGLKPREESFLQNALAIYRGSPPSIRDGLSGVIESIAGSLPKKRIKIVARKKR